MGRGDRVEHAGRAGHDVEGHGSQHDGMRRHVPHRRLQRRDDAGRAVQGPWPDRLRRVQEEVRRQLERLDGVRPAGLGRHLRRGHEVDDVLDGRAGQYGRDGQDEGHQRVHRRRSPDDDDVHDRTGRQGRPDHEDLHTRAGSSRAHDATGRAHPRLPRHRLAGDGAGGAFVASSDPAGRRGPRARARPTVHQARRQPGGCAAGRHLRSGSGAARADRGQDGRLAFAAVCRPRGDARPDASRRGRDVHQHLRPSGGRRGVREAAHQRDDGETARGQRRARAGDQGRGRSQRHPGHRQLRDDVVREPRGDLAADEGGETRRPDPQDGGDGRPSGPAGDRRRARVLQVAHRSRDRRRRGALRLRLLRREPDDVADGQRASARGHRAHAHEQAGDLSARGRRGDDSPAVSGRAGHRAGVVELAVRPEGPRGVRRARVRHRHRRREPADRDSGTPSRSARWTRCRRAIATKWRTWSPSCAASGSRPAFRRSTTT